MVEVLASSFRSCESRSIPESTKPWSVRAFDSSEAMGTIPDHLDVAQQNERIDRDGRQDHDIGCFEEIKTW
jgi:hypothetical protein